LRSRENHKKELKEQYRCLIDFQSQIYKLFYFNFLHLVDSLMHHQFTVSFFVVATLWVCQYSRTPVLALCAFFRASSFIGRSGRGSRNAAEDGPRPNMLLLNTEGLTDNTTSVIEQLAF